MHELMLDNKGFFSSRRSNLERVLHETRTRRKEKGLGSTSKATRRYGDSSLGTRKMEEKRWTRIATKTSGFFLEQKEKRRKDLLNNRDA
jgi:hypothetical protein